MERIKHLIGGIVILFFICASIGSAKKSYVAVLGNTGGSKSDGTLVFAHEHKSTDNFTVDIEDAKTRALEKCKSWGYSGAEFFDTSETRCVSPTRKGCLKWRTTYNCQ